MSNKKKSNKTQNLMKNKIFDKLFWMKKQVIFNKLKLEIDKL